MSRDRRSRSSIMDCDAISDGAALQVSNDLTVKNQMCEEFLDRCWWQKYVIVKSYFISQMIPSKTKLRWLQHAV